jgi:hypothetical protein
LTISLRNLSARRYQFKLPFAHLQDQVHPGEQGSFR